MFVDMSVCTRVCWHLATCNSVRWKRDARTRISIIRFILSAARASDRLIMTHTHTRTHTHRHKHTHTHTQLQHTSILRTNANQLSTGCNASELLPAAGIYRVTSHDTCLHLSWPRYRAPLQRRSIIEIRFNLQWTCQTRVSSTSFVFRLCSSTLPAFLQ